MVFQSDSFRLRNTRPKSKDVIPGTKHLEQPVWAGKHWSIKSCSLQPLRLHNTSHPHSCFIICIIHFLIKHTSTKWAHNCFTLSDAWVISDIPIPNTRCVFLLFHLFYSIITNIFMIKSLLCFFLNKVYHYFTLNGRLDTIIINCRGCLMLSLKNEMFLFGW